MGDKINALINGLKREIRLRELLYETERDQLLTFGDVEWKALASVIKPTYNIKWGDFYGVWFDYIDLSAVCRKTKTISACSLINNETAPSRAQKIVEEGDVIFATTRPTLQRYTLIDDVFANQIASTGYCILRANTEEILPKWIYYNIASTKFNLYVEENQAGSAYPAISDSKVKEFSIPVPPLEDQQRVVEELDSLTTNHYNIIESLEAEIKNLQEMLKSI